MSAYYNELDPYAAQWLRNLIAEGHIAPGDVDTRSIVDVRPDDLSGYTQCHFFAGIGGWSYAARLAGWADDRPLWTGSCPCQPFSVAGKGAGQADIRHLWPVFFDLTRAVRPDVVMGEQVAAAVGRDWLDGVCADLEGVGYACGAAVVPACAVDAPHDRPRIWFVAQSDCAGSQWKPDASIGRPQPRTPFRGHGAIGSGGAGWSRAEALDIGDRRIRRAPPGVRLVAHGVPARVGRLRAYGNAIVPQVAAEVIAAYLEVRATS